MTNYTQKLEELEARLQRAKEAKIRAEAEKEAADRRLLELTKSMEKLGVTPETIGAKIEELDKTISEGIAKLDALIPVL